MITTRSIRTGRRTSAAEAKIEDDGQCACLVDSLYRDLRTMAKRFYFLPGERIDLQALALEFGVSRTPVRLALTRLACEGFLSCYGRKGFFREPLDAKVIFDLYEFRQQMEAAVVRLAAERATDEQLAQFESFVLNIAATNASPAVDEVMAADEQFQKALCALAGNMELRDKLHDVSDHLHYFRWMDLDVQPSEILFRHCAIAGALRKRDAERCLSLMGHQADRSLDRIRLMIERCHHRLHAEAEQRKGPELSWRRPGSAGGILDLAIEPMSRGRDIVHPALSSF